MSYIILESEFRSLKRIIFPLFLGVSVILLIFGSHFLLENMSIDRDYFTVLLLLGFGFIFYSLRSLFNLSILLFDERMLEVKNVLTRRKRIFDLKDIIDYDKKLDGNFQVAKFRALNGNSFSINERFHKNYEDLYLYLLVNSAINKKNKFYN